MRSVTLFLVDDEPLIRLMIARLVEELGHRVVAEAGHIETAESVARHVEFDLALLNIIVGGLNISPIAKIVAGRGLPFFFLSSYGSPLSAPALFRDRPVLQKPFTTSALGALIGTALERTAFSNPSFD